MTNPTLRFPGNFADWKARKLGEITCHIRNGAVYDASCKSGSCMMTRIETISSGKINEAKVGYAEGIGEKYRLLFGDILYSHINSLSSLGKTAIYKNVPDKIYHGMNLLSIRADKNIVDPDFLFISLNLKKSTDWALSHGKRAINQCSISASDIAGMDVKLPSVVEQQKIASFFTALDEKIQNTRKKLVLTLKMKRAFARGIFTRKVGFSSSSDWQDFTLGDVSSIIKTRKSSDFLLYVGTEDLIKDFGGLNKVKKENVSGIYFEKDDILISNIRPYLKKLWMSDEEGIASTDVIVYRSKNIEPSLLKHILSTDSFFEHVAQGYKGSKMPRGDKSQMATFAFQIPSDEKEQKKIANFLNLIDKKITCLREQEKALKKQKQAFMQQMFV